MTKTEMIKLLKKAGFKKIRTGKHETWFKKGFPPIQVQKNKGEIPTGTANRMLKDAGLK